MTMQYDANFIPATFAEAIFRIKQLLKSCGWVVQASSDGTTFSTTPGNVNDVITSAGAGAGGMANPLAWFVIKKPDDGREFCFQRVDDATVYPATVNAFNYSPLSGFSANMCWRIKYTLFAPFTAGTPSAIQTPFSVNEKILVGDGTDAVPVFALVPLYPDGRQTFTISADNAAPYGWWAGGYGYNLDGWFTAGGLNTDQPVTLDVQSDWQPDSLAHAPPPTMGAMMAHDKARQKTIFFGGNGSFLGGYFGITWSWDGTSWSALTLQHDQLPPGRLRGAMVYDEVRQQIVMFGGAVNFPDTVTQATHTWNGTKWTAVFPAASPPARQQHTMVWSPALSAVVLFGGIDSVGTYLNDTWKWDGTNWTQLTTTNTPTARAGVGLGIDPTTGHIIMFGGDVAGTPSSQTYRLNTTTNAWVLLAPATTPPARMYHVMVTDTGNTKIVLFGGDLSGGVYDGATYTWDGTNWTLAVASPSIPSLPGERAPAGRRDAAAAYDSDRGRVVVLTGFPSGNDYGPGGFGNATGNQTWLWNGTQWNVTRALPSSWYGSQMAYDSVRHVLVWFGGISGGSPSTVTDRTWEFDGTKWTRVFPATSPPPRYFHSMTYDVANSRVVLFGGKDITDTALTDTWTYNGTTWTQLFPVTTPTTRFLAAMAYDPVGGRVIMYGGYDGVPTLQSGTWSWNGTNWSLLAPVANPGPRESHAMTSDGTNIWLYGGLDGVPTFQGDTWKWTGTNWTQVTFPLGITQSLPRVGGSMYFDVARGLLVLVGGRNQSGFIPAPGYTWNRNPATGWDQDRDFFEPYNGSLTGQKLPNTGGTDGYGVAAYDAFRSRGHFYHSGHHWYTGKFNGSASGFMFFDPIKNADPSDPDPYVVLITKWVSPSLYSGMQIAFISGYNANYNDGPHANFFYGEAFLPQNAIWETVGGPTHNPSSAGFLPNSGYGNDPAIGGNHVRLWPWIWLQTGGSPAGRGQKGESTFLHLVDRSYGYGGTAITVASARDYMMHKVSFRAYPTDNYFPNDQCRHVFAVPWNGSVQLSSVDARGPYSGNTEWYSVADGSRSSIGAPVQAVTGEIIPMPSQAEVEVDPLLGAQDPLMPMGGGGGGGVVFGSNIVRGGS